MSTSVDIKQLAIERGAPTPPTLKRRGRWLTRYVIPGILLLGFALLVVWAAQRSLWPPQRVWVVPVLASQSTVQAEGAPLFQAAGWIEPRPSLIRVAAMTEGVVEKLLVVEDQPLKVGEPIAELFREDTQLAHEAAEANLKLREAESQEVGAALKAAQSRFEQPVHLQAELSEAESALSEVSTLLNSLPFEIRRAEAEVAYAEANFEGKLSAQGAIAGRLLEEARSLLDKARATHDELKSRVNSLTQQKTALVARRDALQKKLSLRTDELQAKETAEANVAAAQARIEQAKVELAQAELRLKRMTVRAPVDGRVYQLVAFPGTTLSGGMNRGAHGGTVVTLYQPLSLQVRVDVRFEDIPKITLDQPVSINNPALAAPLTGKVLFLTSEANIQKNTLQVKVAIDATETVLKPEMLVDVIFLAPKPEQRSESTADVTRLYLSEELIQHGKTGSFVWLADQSAGVARLTQVSRGSALPGGLIEITQGLSMGSRVIARGFEELQDGDPIEVVSEEPAGTAAPADASQQGT
jgi:HlyD family secretion protein